MRDARAAQYLKSSEACALRAKGGGSEAAEWTRLAREWGKLARASEGVLAISNHAKTERDYRQSALGA
jgi:hypothetical protein